jgi:sugar phosphate isomerase/epimerase
MTENNAPKFGYTTNPVNGIIKEIRKAKRLGVDYVEIPSETLNHPSELIHNRKTIKRELKKHGFFCVVHMAYWVDLGSDYRAVSDGWVKECKNAIRAARAIGAKMFLVHARPQSGSSMRLPKTKKLSIERMIKNMNVLAGHAKRNGIRLVIENEDTSVRLENILSTATSATTMAGMTSTFP